MALDNIIKLKKNIFGKVFFEDDILINQDFKDYEEEYIRVNGKIRTSIPTGRFSLEEVLEWIAREREESGVIIVKDRVKEDIDLDDSWLLLDMELKENKKPKIILYEIGDGSYYVYRKKDPKDYKREIFPRYSIADFLPSGEESRSNSMYIPTGIIIERVPQTVLGNGVLGRAFIYGSHIQVLDSLIGNEYFEVLTHEVLHMMYPDKSELNIRIMTKNIVGDTARYH